MPYRAPTVCAEQGCGALVYDGNRCETHRLERLRTADRRRAPSHRRGYDNEWRVTRAAFLKAHPTCECDECAALPQWRRPTAVDVDHIDGLGPHGPHGHDWNNLRAMTHAHHARKTVREDGGFGRRPEANK